MSFGVDELIVSKTNTRGHITYVNDIFERVSGYDRSELIGKPHNVIRHGDMPGGVFRLMWDTITSGHEIFAYVKNTTKDEGFYWVLAHVTPTITDGRTSGYHSNRRHVPPRALHHVEPLYRTMLDAERGLSGPRAAAASLAVLDDLLVAKGVTYEEFVWSIILDEVR